MADRANLNNPPVPPIGHGRGAVSAPSKRNNLQLIQTVSTTPVALTSTPFNPGLQT